MSLAWHTAYLTRVAKMPKLAALQIRRARAPQTKAATRNAVVMLSEIWGIPLRPRMNVKVIDRG